MGHLFAQSAFKSERAIQIENHQAESKLYLWIAGVFYVTSFLQYGYAQNTYFHFPLRYMDITVCLANIRK